MTQTIANPVNDTTTDAAGPAAEERRGRVDLTPAELDDRRRSGAAVIVDVREPDEFRRERIDGAVNVPLSKLTPSEVARAAGVAPRDSIVLHCQGGVRSAQAANRLLEAGWPTAAHLDGGLGAWKKAGLPTKIDRRAPISVMRQVQLVVGSMVLLFTLLGAFVSPWLLIVPAFFGAGLTFAGASGWCGLALVLSKMPWNAAPAAATPPVASCDAGCGDSAARNGAPRP